MHRTIIVSDLHIGSAQFLRNEFLAFLDSLPPEATLVFNGDVVDSRVRAFSPAEEAVMDRIEEESHRRHVIWVSGNHDERFVHTPHGRIEYKASHNLGTRLLITHGSEFDGIRRRAFVFYAVFRIFHYLRMALGAPRVHVAFYAKKWPRLYGILRHHVARRAVRYAKKNGYSTVICGHIHSAEDTTVDGIRYINTGTWTEHPPHYVLVEGDRIELMKWGDAHGAHKTPPGLSRW